MNDFRFDEKTHSYFLGDKRLTGVTSIIGVLAKPALIGWAAKMACEHIRDTGAERTIDGIHYILTQGHLIEEARTAHTRKKEAAGTHGTDAHALVEQWVKACIESFQGKPVNTAEEDAITPFKKWAVENVDHFLFSERRMFNKELFIAGTADFGCVLQTGQKLIGDFKTSSGVYGIDYYLQCAGYKILAEGEGDEPYDGCVIVRLGKKGPKDFDVTYNYDCATAEKSFLACLTLYRAQDALKETALRD